MSLDIPIIFENDDVLVLNKPAGLVVHADGRTKEVTLVDWLLERYPEIKEVGEPTTLSNGEIIYRPGIVHRLDRDTSGVIIVAKTQAAFLLLKSQFQTHKIEKEYRAFVYGVVKEKKGIINRPISRSRNDFRLWSAQRGGRGDGREAVTHFEVLKTAPKLECETGVSYVKAMPRTGRTHQIRVHFKAINHPVVADPLYAPKRDAVLGFKRLALHGLSLTCEIPGGDVKTFTAPLPADFIEAEKRINVA